MAVKSIFGGLAGAFEGEGEKEGTHADIPAELKAELQSIQEMERETLDGAGVFSRQKGAVRVISFSSSIWTRCTN